MSKLSIDQIEGKLKFSNTLNTIAVLQELHEEAKQEAWLAGIHLKNLRQGDAVSFMSGDPNDRLRFGFQSGMFPSETEE